MGLGTILLIILILMLLGAFPRWGYSRNWGYGPSGGLGLVLAIVLILVLLGASEGGFDPAWPWGLPFGIGHVAELALRSHSKSL